MNIRGKLIQWLFKTLPLEQKDQVSAAFNTVTISDWYKRNGYSDIIAAFGGGYTSYTGRTVNQESALQDAAFYAGTRMLSEDMGSLPRHVYEFAADYQSTEKTRGTALYRTMHNLVNPEVSAGEFVEALTAHAIVAQRGLAEIQRETNNLRKSEIAYLWPWMPSEVRTDRDSKNRTVYIRKEGHLQEKTYKREQVFHLKGFTFTGYEGDDLLQRARHALGLNLAQQEFAGTAFKNGIHADLFFEHPGVGDGLALEADAVRKIKNAYAEHQGLSAVATPFVLREGMKANRQPVDMEKWQLGEQQKRGVLTVCRLLRIPPHKLAELDRAIQSNIEELSIDYVVYSLGPWDRRWKEAFYRCLLTLDEQVADRLYLEHDFHGLLRGNFKAQTEGFRAMLEKGVYSINEVRRMLNLNPVEGGDEHHIQLNMQAVSETAGQLASDVQKELRRRVAEGKSLDDIESEIDTILRGMEKPSALFKVN